MDKFDWFKYEFENLSESEQVDVYNKYCDINKTEGTIYCMEDLDELFTGVAPTKLFAMAEEGFNINDDYFIEKSLGLESFNDVWSFLDDYLYDIYKCKEAWEKDIDEAGYFNEIYEEFYNEKPQDMDDDEYCDLIEKAIKQYELESDIVNYLKQNME